MDELEMKPTFRGVVMCRCRTVPVGGRRNSGHRCWSVGKCD